MSKKHTTMDTAVMPTSSTPPIKPPGQLMWEHGYYYMADGFTIESVKPIIQWILEANLRPISERVDHLTLIITSRGGYIAEAMSLIDTIKGSAIPVHTIGLGCIASCGVLTFMAGAKRILTKNTQIMSHQFSGGAGGKEHDLFATVRGWELTSKRIMQHYRKCTGMSKKKIKKYLLPPQDVYLTAKEAVKYGLADEIVETY